MKLFLIIGIVVLCIVLYNKFFKIPKLNNVVLVTGGVKTGKSTMSVYFVLKKYKDHGTIFKTKSNDERELLTP